MAGVIVPRRPKLDELRSIVIGEYPFQAFVELLGKSGDIFRGIELGPLQLFWLCFNKRCNERAMCEPTRDHLPCPGGNEFSSLQQAWQERVSNRTDDRGQFN